MKYNFILAYLALPFFLVVSVLGVPTSVSVESRSDRGGSESLLQLRTTPVFPDQPPSCPICAKDYPNLSSCAEAAPVLQNFTNIIFNPGAFIDVIKCACVDTFQAVFPQCVDCFIKTGQENILNTPNLPGVVDGMRKICAIESTLLGNVSAADGETVPTASPPPPPPTSNTAVRVLQEQERRVFVVVLATVLGAGLASFVL